MLAEQGVDIPLPGDFCIVAADIIEQGLELIDQIDRIFPCRMKRLINVIRIILCVDQRLYLEEAVLEERYPCWSGEDYEIELYRERYLFTYDSYCDCYERLESDTTYYTTPGGEEIGIICSYGYDG